MKKLDSLSARASHRTGTGGTTYTRKVWVGITKLKCYRRKMEHWKRDTTTSTDASRFDPRENSNVGNILIANRKSPEGELLYFFRKCCQSNFDRKTPNKLT